MNKDSIKMQKYKNSISKKINDTMLKGIEENLKRSIVEETKLIEMEYKHGSIDEAEYLELINYIEEKKHEIELAIKRREINRDTEELIKKSAELQRKKFEQDLNAISKVEIPTIINGTYVKEDREEK